MQRSTHRHTILKLLKTKNKGKILRGARENDSSLTTAPPIRITVNFSKETVEARRKCDDIFKH